MNWIKYNKDNKQYFAKMSDNKLITSFNGQVGNSGLTDNFL